MATFLAAAHQSDWAHHDRSQSHDGSGIFLAEQLRWSHVGLADEAYESIHELEEFGLIKIVDPMPTRRRGRFKPQPVTDAGSDESKNLCYRLVENVFSGRPSTDGMYNVDVLNHPAIDVAIEQLARPMPRYARP